MGGDAFPVVVNLGSTLALGRCQGLDPGPRASRAPLAPAPPLFPPSPARARAPAACCSLPPFARGRASPVPQLPAKMAESGEGLGTVPEHERILQEIESTDTACVGPTLR